MKFTGTLIEDLMATVERAERRAHPDGALSIEASAVEPKFGETCSVDLWFISGQENAVYDSKLMGVA